MIGFAVLVACMIGGAAMACRVAKMSPETREMVAWQHIQMGMGFAAAPVVWYFADAAWALLMLSASMVVYVLMGASRWRDGAPAGTRKDGHGSVSHQAGMAADRPTRQRVPEDRPGSNGAVLRGTPLHARGDGAQGAGRAGTVAALRVRR